MRRARDTIARNGLFFFSIHACFRSDLKPDRLGPCPQRTQYTCCSASTKPQSMLRYHVVFVFFHYEVFSSRTSQIYTRKFTVADGRLVFFLPENSFGNFRTEEAP